ncbi:MAG: hypothetical protein OJF47_000246 [Nitrospira sp.]|nr:MAG: hypothetical protein OJF47_000246 [Nitrospira sp.]
MRTVRIDSLKRLNRCETALRQLDDLLCGIVRQESSCLLTTFCLTLPVIALNQGEPTQRCGLEFDMFMLVEFSRQDGTSNHATRRGKMLTGRMILGAVLLGGLTTLLSPQAAHSLSDAAALERKLQTTLAENAQHHSDPAILTKLADLYLDLGDEQIDAVKRRAAYEEGAKYAGQALAIQERNAQAHYLYAANLGSAAQLKGVMTSAMTVTELKTHVRRALELQPDHPPALHMMGMMLNDLPWLLGGDAAAALTYLQRATAADPSYVHARLDLARAYIKRRAFDDARRELGIILEAPISSLSSNSARRHRDEAATLLDSLTVR